MSAQPLGLSLRGCGARHPPGRQCRHGARDPRGDRRARPGPARPRADGLRRRRAAACGRCRAAPRHPPGVSPRSSGVFTALGMLASDIEHTALKTVSRRLDRMDVADLQAIKAELRQRSPRSAGRRRLSGRSARRQLRWEADLRHEGQATELTVPFDRADDAQRAARGLRAPNTSRPTATARRAPIELVNLRVGRPIGTARQSSRLRQRRSASRLARGPADAPGFLCPRRAPVAVEIVAARARVSGPSPAR